MLADILRIAGSYNPSNNNGSYFANRASNAFLGADCVRSAKLSLLFATRSTLGSHQQVEWSAAQNERSIDGFSHLSDLAHPTAPKNTGHTTARHQFFAFSACYTIFVRARSAETLEWPENCLTFWRQRSLNMKKVGILLIGLSLAGCEFGDRDNKRALLTLLGMGAGGTLGWFTGGDGFTNKFLWSAMLAAGGGWWLLFG